MKKCDCSNNCCCYLKMIIQVNALFLNQVYIDTKALLGVAILRPSETIIISFRLLFHIFVSVLTWKFKNKKPIMTLNRSSKSIEVHPQPLSGMINYNPSGYYFYRLCRGPLDNASNKHLKVTAYTFWQFLLIVDVQMTNICKEHRITNLNILILIQKETRRHTDQDSDHVFWWLTGKCSVYTRFSVFFPSDLVLDPIWHIYKKSFEAIQINILVVVLLFNLVTNIFINPYMEAA